MHRLDLFLLVIKQTVRGKLSSGVTDVIYIKVSLFKFLQGCKVVMVSLQAGIHVPAPHHLRDGQHHLVDTHTN